MDVGLVFVRLLIDMTDAKQQRHTQPQYVSSSSVSGDDVQTTRDREALRSESHRPAHPVGGKSGSESQRATLQLAGDKSCRACACPAGRAWAFIA